MKKQLTILLLMVFSLGSITAQNEPKPAAINTIEVYYFHFTRRCVTCNAVETETVKALNTLYAKEMANKTIKFTTVNLDEKQNNALAKKCKAEGQALLIISNNTRTDLTEQGFMYARSSPEKLQAAIKAAIDKVLKK